MSSAGQCTSFLLRLCGASQELTLNFAIESVLDDRTQSVPIFFKGKKMQYKSFLSIGCVAATCVFGGCAVQPTKEVVATQNAPGAIGPYSQAIKVGSALYVSGQIAIDPETGQMNTGSIEEQTKLALENVKAILSASNMSMTNVVSTTVYVKDLNDFSKMNGVYARYFEKNPPARATVQVARLPRDAAIEISVIATK